MRKPEQELNCFIVGGAVRDELLGKAALDRDWVIVGHTVDEVLDAGFEQVVGEDFPVFLHPETNEEFAMARTEEKVSAGHHGFEVQTSPEVTLEDDLSRRDLTINAMAKDPETGEIIDPFGGQEDLEAGIIRHTTEAFKEDPLRVLRAARFARRLDFEIHEDTLSLCEKVAPELREMAPERIAKELRTTLARADAEAPPSRFFRALDEMNALNEAFPELASLKSVPAGPSEFHEEGSAFEHTMLVLDKARPTKRDQLAALSHDLGKSRTPEEILPNHYGHDKEGAFVAERMANRLRLSNAERGVMIDAAELHMKFKKVPEMRASTVINMVERLEGTPTHISCEELIQLTIADNLGRKPEKTVTLGEHRRRVTAAKQVIREIGGKEILEMHPDKEPGEWVGDEITKERVERFREVLEDG